MKCADMADAFDDGYKRGFNAAIDKAVEVVDKLFDGLDDDANFIREELKKLKEV